MNCFLLPRAAIALTFALLACTAANSQTTGGATSGGSATGGSATGGTATGGSVTGGSVTGGSATGGSVTGGSVTGGSVTGGSATGGSATAGTVSGGTITPGKVTPGTATATIGGREVSAVAEGNASVRAEGDTASVTLGKHVLTIEKERLLLDGMERGKLKPSTLKVKVTLAKGHLKVEADGVEVLSSDLKE